MKFIEKLDKRIFRFSLDIIFFIAGVLHIYVYSLSNEREIQTFNVIFLIPLHSLIFQ